MESLGIKGFVDRLSRAFVCIIMKDEPSRGPTLGNYVDFHSRRASGKGCRECTICGAAQELQCEILQCVAFPTDTSSLPHMGVMFSEGPFWESSTQEVLSFVV